MDLLSIDYGTTRRGATALLQDGREVRLGVVIDENTYPEADKVTPRLRVTNWTHYQERRTGNRWWLVPRKQTDPLCHAA